MGAWADSVSIAKLPRGLGVVLAKHSDRKRDLYRQFGVDSSTRVIYPGNFGVGTLATRFARRAAGSVFHAVDSRGHR